MTPTTNPAELRKLRKSCTADGCRAAMRIYAVSRDGYTREWECPAGGMFHREIETLGRAQSAQKGAQ